MTEIVFSLKETEIKRSLLNGFTHQGGSKITLDPGTDYHSIITEPVDGGMEDCTWGRLCFNAELPEDGVLISYVFASNYLINTEELKSRDDFLRLGAKRTVSNRDLLLYDIKGKYLYILIEVIGEGEGNLYDIRIDRLGDNFMDAFPDIYKDRGGFFHRYLSVFSSIYNDMGEKITNLPSILDLDKCPVEFLVVYGGWLGIDLNCDIQDEEILRTLVKEAYNLNRIKGTKACVSRISEIMLGEEAIILEKNIMEGYQDETSLEEFKSLFGNNVYNVCILVNKMPSETLKSQYMYVLKQFVPVRAKVTIINLEKEGELDYHSYMDMNAKLFKSAHASLDKELALDHIATLM